MVWGARVFDFVLQIVATGIGAYWAYVGGANLLKIELEAGRIQRIKEREEETQQKIIIVVEILLIEIRQHKNNLPKEGVRSYMSRNDKITTYPTVSYDGLLSSGLFFSLPVKTQDIVRFHYGRAGSVKEFLTLDREYYLANDSLGNYDDEIMDALTKLVANVDNVIATLDSLLPPVSPS